MSRPFVECGLLFCSSAWCPSAWPRRR